MQCGAGLCISIFLLPGQIKLVSFHSCKPLFCQLFIPIKRTWIYIIVKNKRSKWFCQIHVFCGLRKPHTKQSCFKIRFYKVPLSDTIAGVRSWGLNSPFPFDFRMATNHFHLKLLLDINWKLLPHFPKPGTQQQAGIEPVCGRLCHVSRKFSREYWRANGN